MVSEVMWRCGRVCGDVGGDVLASEDCLCWCWRATVLVLEGAVLVLEGDGVGGRRVGVGGRRLGERSDGWVWEVMWW